MFIEVLQKCAGIIPYLLLGVLIVTAVIMGYGCLNYHRLSYIQIDFIDRCKSFFLGSIFTLIVVGSLLHFFIL